MSSATYICPFYTLLLKKPHPVLVVIFRLLDLRCLRTINRAGKGIRHRRFTLLTETPRSNRRTALFTDDAIRPCLRQAKTLLTDPLFDLLYRDVHLLSHFIYPGMWIGPQVILDLLELLLQFFLTIRA